MKHGKKYTDSFKAVEPKLYESAEALEFACKNAKAKFDETIEVHVRLGVDSRHADQQVRGAVVLPNGTGKNVRVCVFCKEDKYEAAKAAGAEFVGGQDLVEKITKENWMDFDVVIASPDMMGLVGRLGKILGPRGLMPNPKAGTVAPDVAKAITEAKAGKIEYRLPRQASFTALSVRLLSVLKSSTKTSQLSSKLSQRLSRLQQRVLTSSHVLFLQQWALVFRFSQTNSTVNYNL